MHFLLLTEYIAVDGFDCDVTSTDDITTWYPEDSTEDKIEIVEASGSDEDEEGKNVLFIFHGAPGTGFFFNTRYYTVTLCTLSDYHRGANQVGIALSVPVCGIDRLIIESLVESTNPIAAGIRESIDKAYRALLGPKSGGVAEIDTERGSCW